MYAVHLACIPGKNEGKVELIIYLYIIKRSAYNISVLSKATYDKEQRGFLRFKCIKCSTNCANASAAIGSTIEENGIFKVTLGQVG